MEATDTSKGRRGRVHEGRRRNGQLYPNGQWMLVSLTTPPPDHRVAQALCWRVAQPPHGVGQGLSRVGGPGVNPPSTPH